MPIAVAVKGAQLGVAVGVGVLLGGVKVGVCVGRSVGVSVAGGPEHTAILNKDSGRLPLVLELLPPPQLSNSAEATKHTTGAKIRHLPTHRIEH